MATSQSNQTANRDATLRRVAIVLSSLPAPVAAKLLGTIDTPSKQSIRQAMATLADVDPLERKRALQAFKSSVQSQPQTTSRQATSRQTTSRQAQDSQSDRAGADDDIFITRTSVGPSVASQGNPQTDLPFSSTAAVLKNASTIDASPLAFLGDVEDDRLVSLLSGEHPQAVALVLASIAPAQAARVLPRLESGLRSAALSRVGRMSEVPESAANDVAEHFRDRLRNEAVASASPQSTTGKRALDAILAAMPREVPEPHDLPEPYDSPEPDPTPTEAMILNRRLHAATHSGGFAGGADAHREQVDAPERHSDSVHSAAPSTIPMVADRAEAMTARPEDGKPKDGDPKDGEPKSADTPDWLRSTDAIHDHLVRLSPSQLCQALGRVGTRDAMLALCGLPNAKAEAVLAVLPKDQAKVVRSQMNSLNSMNLRDIDVAKERVASASVEQASQTAPMPIAA